MLFSTPEFLFLFFPIVLIVFMALLRLRPQVSLYWLVFASFLFYAEWNLRDLLVLIASIAWNYGFGRAISMGRNQGRFAKAYLIIAVSGNLAALGYFKYLDFVLSNLRIVFEFDAGMSGVILPLGISFFTFTQIAYLVDVYVGKKCEDSIAKYCLFVTFFPHLIAGPVLHHSDMMPQFDADKLTSSVGWEKIGVGLSILAVGLFKKVVIADYFGGVATSGFSTNSIDLIAGWIAALSYTLQLYFDFSGYSDMAIGISWCFGIWLPLNFNSPYKAASIVDFWRRWHISLSTFLRDYLYITLGGNRKGEVRRYLNLFITMLIGGIWHGAGWTFVFWGAWHGVLLLINHAWIAFGPVKNKRIKSQYWYRIVCWGVTFLVVVVGWVFFRAHSFPQALSITGALFGLNGIHWGYAASNGVSLLAIFLALAGCLLLPNTQSVFSKFLPYPERGPKSILDFKWKASLFWVIVIGVIFATGIGALGRDQLFLYFNF